MMYVLCYYFMIFIVYAFFGWIIESIACSYIDKKIVLNRGFLIGPYIPIYGLAALLMIVFLNEYKEDPFVLFCMAAVYVSMLEYFTNFWMEKVFHARWWDYSNEKWNLNGRICLRNSFLFGLLGLLLLYVVQPFIGGLLNQIPSNIFIIIACILATIIITDAVITIKILCKLNIHAKHIKKDATQEIDREVKKMLKHDRVFYKRLLRAFPKVRYTSSKGDVLINHVRKRFDEVDLFLQKKKRDIEKAREKIKSSKDQDATKDKIKKQKEELKEIKKRKPQ